ncbi:hypothetical protein [Arthrobacter sp. Cr_A7]|uniref:hypothetical protein n=1 Tax=Arthrobacter sp. Cr_A7 TaxID=3031017 RepID=UPI0023DBF16C|nr:hypothetical protein [Arthrobacter sp. Cr_A7]MDF2052132.1 hypothetical protein [Arthrobacter sp. Cr_A7]
MHVAPGYLVVTVHTRRELDAALDEAVDLLKPAAMAGQVGISVTRLATGLYEARVNNNVPAGVSLERWGVSGDE